MECVEYFFCADSFSRGNSKYAAKSNVPAGTKANEREVSRRARINRYVDSSIRPGQKTDDTKSRTFKAGEKPKSGGRILFLRGALRTTVGYACHEFAQQSTRFSSWADQFYRRQREKGKSHHSAIRHWHSSGYALSSPAGRPTILTMNPSISTPSQKEILPLPRLDGAPQTLEGTDAKRGRRPFKPSIRGSCQATHNPFESSEKCLDKGFTGDQRSAR